MSAICGSNTTITSNPKWLRINRARKRRFTNVSKFHSRVFIKSNWRNLYTSASNEINSYCYSENLLDTTSFVCDIFFPFLDRWLRVNGPSELFISSVHDALSCWKIKIYYALWNVKSVGEEVGNQKFYMHWGSPVRKFTVGFGTLFVFPTLATIRKYSWFCCNITDYYELLCKCQKFFLFSNFGCLSFEAAATIKCQDFGISLWYKGATSVHLIWGARQKKNLRIPPHCN